MLVALASCTKKQETSVHLSADQLVEKGQQIFLLNCVSCHGPDPKKDGPIGPSIAGSSQALLEARVLAVKYPQGYVPKRTTALMVALPHLKNDISALYSYLNAGAAQ